ncbi:MAG: hypothetical protein K2G84_03085, partial [Muribaculaceae bacterium]|nr:hypothetical protein [Muribaculaceae bacterium]
LTATVSLASYAANKDEITLTVTSDGATKDEAIKNALRTAVEQTYGVFVSANTDILNDDLIKDEIATVSSGNIKKFTELAHTKNDNSHTITLNVIVSKGKLLSYAKSKGAECELDGEAMFADIQLQELYKNNEERMFENICSEFEQLIKNGYDYKIDVKRAGKSYSGYYASSYGYYNPNTDPENNVCFECKIYVKLNEQGELAWKKLITALNSAGKSYNPNKEAFKSSLKYMFSGNIDEYDNDNEFTSVVRIMKPTSNMYGVGWMDMFRVRSGRTVQLVDSLMENIPYIVRNISIEYAGKVLDISKELQYLRENHSDGSLTCLNMTRPYTKKKGGNCGEYRYFLNVSQKELKGIKGISVKANKKQEFYGGPQQYIRY